MNRRASKGGVRRRWIVLVALLAVFAVLCAVATRLYVFPDEEEPGPVDAIVVLGGLSSRPVTDKAIDLAGQGFADLIVISDAFGGDTRPANLCEKDATVSIECFQPDPATTRGEARAIAGLAEERGWRSVTVVTAGYHVSRARLLIGRCFSGSLTMAAASVPLDLAGWIHQYAYQTAGFADALLDPQC